MIQCAVQSEAIWMLKRIMLRYISTQVVEDVIDIPNMLILSSI